MNRRITTASITAIITLTLVGCGGEDGAPSLNEQIGEDALNNRTVEYGPDGKTTSFGSEHDRHRVFSQWICDTGKEADPAIVSATAATHVMAESSDQGDKKVALDILQGQQGADAIDPSVPLTVSPDGETCEGWVWDNYLAAQEDSLYETFTDEKANELGYL